MKQIRLSLIIIILSLVGLHFQDALAQDARLRTQITGLSGDALHNVESRLATLESTYGSRLSDYDIQNYFNKAPLHIKKALEPYGYFKADIKARLTQERGQWIASFTVRHGPALHITELELAVFGPGQENPAIQKCIKHFPLKVDQVFSVEQYNSAVELLFQMAINEGYIKAEFAKKSVQINLQDYSAKVILQLDTQERYYFGTVTFSDNPFTEPFLKRLVTIHPNEPFSSEKLLKMQNDLTTLHYFKEIEVVPDFAAAENYHVPIRIQVSVPKSKQYKIGVGYGTFTGPRLTLGADFRRIGTTGQHFSTEIKWSSVISGIAAKYFIPGKNPLTDQYAVGGNFQKFSPKNGNSMSETLSMSYAKKINEWQTTTALNYLNERYYVNAAPYHSSHLLYPSFSLSLVKADDLVDTHRGGSLHFNLQGAYQPLLSTTSFIQTALKGKYVFSPTLESHIILRGEVGYTVVNDLFKLPLTMQFFAGGINTVRGYAFDTLGPGRYLRVVSVEYQHKIVGNWFGAVFYDIGAASNDFTSPLNRGTGLGLIYKSLVGPVKLYVGQGVNAPGHPYRVEFSIGTDL